MFQLRVLTSTPKIHSRLTTSPLLRKSSGINRIENKFLKNTLGTPLLILCMVWVAMILFAGICISLLP